MQRHDFAFRKSAIRVIVPHRHFSAPGKRPWTYIATPRSRWRLPTSRQGPTSRRSLSSAAFGERRSPVRQVWRDRRARKRRRNFLTRKPLINQKMRKKSRFPDPAATAGHHVSDAAGGIGDFAESRRVAAAAGLLGVRPSFREQWKNPSRTRVREGPHFRVSTQPKRRGRRSRLQPPLVAEKGAYGFDIARCRTEIGAARRSSGEDCRRRRRRPRLTRCRPRASLPAGRRPRRARRRWRAFPRWSWRRCRRRRAGGSGRSLRRGSGSACSATRYARDR